MLDSQGQYTPPMPMRRNCLIESRRVGAGGVYTKFFATRSRRLPTGAFTADTTQLDFAVGKYVQTRRDCRQL